MGMQRHIRMSAISKVVIKAFACVIFHNACQICLCAQRVRVRLHASQ